ncbi:MAG: hypothetical protein MUF54_02950 [Polyangiaceae bacterium]|jgi:hypothetical protein|nr:hypothetical protein [Polyangiaceae bacterium]
MARLPTVGADSGNWGTVLNEYLETAHNADGTLKLDVKTIADLKAIDVTTLTDKQQALVAGYAVPEDGGGGVFYYDAAASTADNSGTVIAPTAGSGRWIRTYSGPVNVRWFGARGDSTGSSGNGTDDTTAFLAAIETLQCVYVPAGTYRVLSTLTIKTGMIGEARKTTFIFFDAVAGDGLRLSEGAYGTVGATRYRYQELRNLTVIGNLTGNYRVAVKSENTTNAVVDNVHVNMVRANPAVYACFGFSDCWGCSFTNLHTVGTNLSTTGVGFLLGRDFNANQCSNWYTSNAGCYANIIDDFDLRCFPAATGHGSNFSQMTLQGGRYGIRLGGQLKDCAWSSIYSENVVTSIALGVSGGNVIYSHTFTGGSIGGPQADHPDYASRRAAIEMIRARHCDFYNINFAAVYGTPSPIWAVWYEDTRQCRFMGGKVQDGAQTLASYIVRSTNTGVSNGSKLMIIGDVFLPVTHRGMSLVMPTNDSYSKHYIMSVGDDGAWDAAAWTPVATDSPPV